MAFHFNWSPLIADTVGAREMLTSALNKSPKPPIIVDDIVVTELNLGKRPPDLEILEIGDLAEDRFRGIFKMSYAGDAFLTLKTRVQANPLNTYLSTRPSFASPETLAAASGLTIPLQITLSDIRLSGFVILVFSRQKGLTLVFRNDPLESLKVSSTFDSIPFVRDYLQKEIEAQLRVLFVEDLPAIIHKLSLRLWSPEYYDLAMQNPLLKAQDGDGVAPIDPLASPPQDPAFDDGNIPEVSLHDHGSDAAAPSNFSQKNLAMLSNLSDAQQRTMSLFSPGFRDMLFRAGTGTGGREPSSSGRNTPILPSMHRTVTSQSSAASVDSFNSSAPDSETLSYTHSRAGSASSHPTLFSSQSGHSASSTYAMSSKHSTSTRQRKRKHRVIDLRKGSQSPTSPTMESEAGTETTTPEPSVGPSSAPSIAGGLESIAEEPGAQVFSAPASVLDTLPIKESIEIENTPPPAYSSYHSSSGEKKGKEKQRYTLHVQPTKIHIKTTSPPPTSSATSPIPLLRSLSADRLSGVSHTSRSQSPVSATGGILEQAWMLKMAREVAKRVEEERRRKEMNQGSNQTGEKTRAGLNILSRQEENDAPPAYVG